MRRPIARPGLLLLFALPGTAALATPHGAAFAGPSSTDALVAARSIILTAAQRAAATDLRCMVASTAGTPPPVVSPNDDSQWLNLIDVHRQKMQALNEALRPYRRILVPRDPDDVEAQDALLRLRRALAQTAFQRDTLQRLMQQIAHDRGLAPVTIPAHFDVATSLPSLLHQVEVFTRELDHLLASVGVTATDLTVENDGERSGSGSADLARSLRCVARRAAQSWRLGAATFGDWAEGIHRLPIHARGDLMSYAYALEGFHRHWGIMLHWSGRLGETGSAALAGLADAALLPPRLRFMKQASASLRRRLYPDQYVHYLYHGRRIPYVYEAIPRPVAEVMRDSALGAERLVTLLSGPWPLSQ